MNNEIWKPILNCDRYVVSNLGNVRHVNKTTCLYQGNWGDYHIVRLGKYGGSHLVHRLVAQAFVPNPEDKPQVNHKDGNKHNNCADNLEWVTASENAQHAIRTGLHVYTPEVRKAISDGLKGKPKSEEHRRKIAIAAHNLSDEDRRKKSEYARNRTPEHRKHLSEAHKGHHPSEETLRKMSIAQQGKTHTEETKEKIRLSKQGKIWVNNGISRTMIRPEDLQLYLDKGYAVGMYKA